MYVIGLDIGTSGVKSTVFGEDANALYHAYREYNLISEADGQFELNPNELYAKTLEVLTESINDCNRNEVRAICATSFGESFICLDENDRVLSNTMIYMDKRGAEECEEFLRLVPEKEIFETSGAYVDPMMSIYKMRWTNKHRPQIIRDTRKICLIADFIIYMLGADHICDYSLAARTGMFNVRLKKWWNTAVDFSGIRESVLPTPVPSGTVVGTLSEKIARQLGVNKSVKLIIGGHDQICAALGSGAIEKSDAANGMGTVDCLTPVVEAYELNLDKLLQYKMPIVPFLGDGKYITMSFVMSGGATIKWFRDTLAKDVAARSDAYDLLHREIPGDPSNILVIPYLGGGSTPDMDAATPAAISGMRLNTTRGELFRAFMQGVTYECMRGMDCLKEAGVTFSRIIAVGGGSRSDVWTQMKADALGHEILVAKQKEAGTLASAILCHANIGVYDNIEQAQKELIEIEKTFVPRKEITEMYQENMKKYMKFYNAVKEVYR